MQTTRDRVRRSLPVALVVLTAATLTTSAATIDAQPRARHQIRFERPLAVGARARLVLHGEKVMRMTSPGHPDPRAPETTVVDFVAVEEVLAVNANGDATRVRYDVERFVVVHDGQTSNPVPQGGQIEVTRASTETQAEPVVRVNGAPVSEAVVKALKVVMSLRVNPVSDDEVFGSTRPRRVGERWPVNGRRAREGFGADSGMRFTRLGGQVRAIEERTVGGEPCLVLRANLEGAMASLPGLPPQARSNGVTIRMQLEGAFPVDVTKRALAGSMEMEMEAGFTLRGANGQSQRFQVSARETRTEEVTLLN